MSDIVQKAIELLEDWDTCYSYNEEIRDTSIAALKSQSTDIEKLRKALKAILNDAGYHNPMRMTTEISDKVLEDAAGALDDYNI